MRKEVLIAVVSGSLLGLIIAFGVWRANSALNFKKSSVPGLTDQESISQEKTVRDDGKIGLSFVRPQNEQVVTFSPVTIEGITKENTQLVASSENEDYLINSNKEGSFKIDTKLIGGINEILVYAFDEKHTPVSEKILLVYSTEFSESRNSKDPENTSDESDLEHKVQEKLEKAKNVPVCYIGTVTDLTSDSIQLDKFEFDGNKGVIMQVAVNVESTSFVKITKTSEKIKFSDIAIGDFIVAMGYKNGKEVLNAQRILVLSALKPTTRKVFKGTVKEILQAELTLFIPGSNENLSISIPKNVIVRKLEEENLVRARLSDITEESEIIVVTQLNKDNKQEVRTIFLI